MLPLPNVFSYQRPVAALGVLGLLVLGACGPATLPQGDRIADVDEAQNRAVHRFNLALDRAVVVGDRLWVADQRFDRLFTASAGVLLGIEPASGMVIESGICTQRK